MENNDMQEEEFEGGELFGLPIVDGKEQWTYLGHAEKVSIKFGSFKDYQTIVSMPVAPWIAKTLIFLIRVFKLDKKV